jgi:hypothetical protein
MKFILPIFLLCSYIGYTQVNNSVNAYSTPGKPAATKSVVIYSSNNSFFEDYPIDSLVEHLNLMNKNPGITYYKSSNDDSKTGFKGDYLVDLKLSKSEHEFVIPRVKEVPVTRPVMRAIQNAGGSVRYEISEEIAYYTTVVEHSVEPKTYYLAAQGFRKNPYKKFKLAQWQAKGDLSDKAAIIIKLIYHLLQFADDSK